MEKRIRNRIMHQLAVLAGIFAVLWCCMCMGGCGAQTPAGEAEESGDPWQYTKYWEEPAVRIPEAGMRHMGRWSAASGSDFYWLDGFLGKEGIGPGARKYCLNRLDTLTMEAERTEFRFTGLSEEARGMTRELFEELARDLDENWLEITGMDIQDDKICLLAAQMDSETKKLAGYYAIRADRQGKVESAVDLLPEVKRSGMMVDNFLPEGILCGGDGQLYIGNSRLGSFGIFDRDGKFSGMVEPPDGAEGSVFYAGRLPDGRPGFGCGASGSEGTVFFACKGQEEELLYEAECSIPEAGYLGDEGEILFMENGRLMCWDGSSGKCERLYQDTGLAMLSGEAVIKNSPEEITLVFYDRKEGVTIGIWLQLDAGMEETVLTFLQLSGDQKLKNVIGEYNRKHPGARVELIGMDQEEDIDTALTRLAAQMSKGEGPDLLAVPLEQLGVLQEQDVLTDLTGVLPKEVEQQIFPAVLECGMVDGKLYGIVTEVGGVSTAAVSQKLWQGEMWTWRDVAELMEGGAGKAGGFTGVVGDSSPLELLKFLAVTDISAGTSSFVDHERKECFFGSDDFVRLLEFCMKYGSGSGMGGDSFEEKIGKVQKGEILACKCAGNLMSFSRCMAALGEGYRCVGYPTDGEYGGYIECYYCVGVNPDSEKKDMAYDVLRYLLGDSGQRKIGVTTVRRDILSACVEDGTPAGQEPLFRSGLYLTTPLEGRSDGSSFLPEYMEILEKGKSRAQYSTIERIIIEEAAAYFEGDRTAKEAAEIIQSRIWLYLKENG